MIDFAISADSISWQTPAAHGSAFLRIVDAKGTAAETTFADSQTLRLDIAAQKLADGTYAYDLILAPPGPLRTRNATDTTQSTVVGQHLSGVFSISGGHFVLPMLEPQKAPAAAAAPTRTRAGGATLQDIVTTGNNEIQGSLCIGLDCVANENFGFDTVRLKENNTRITFADTSTTAGDPATSWQIVANDSASGGANYLGIGEGQGAPAPSMPARVSAGARAHALHVASNGNVGVGIATPLTAVHILSTDTPGIRLEQTNLSGFTAQTWDVAGNEANFFVRDLTHGSTLPFRVRPGASESSIDIAGNGSVGLATPRPRASLHLFRVDGSTSVRVEEASPTASTRVLMHLMNKGPVAARLAFSDSLAWTATADTGFRFEQSATLLGMSLDAAGNLTIPGTLSQGSSWSLKHDIHALDVDRTLEQLRSLPVYTWQYRADSAETRHAGPMAEDVHGRFNIGESPRALAPGDVAGLAAAATQSLARELAAKDAELDALMNRLAALERRLDAENAP